MTEEGFKGAIAQLGAIEFLTVCALALERQAKRLKAARVPSSTGMDSFHELAPDVWFAVVALHRSFTALDFAARTSKIHGREIQALAKELPNRKAIKRVRDVYEHFDDYFQFRDKLQKREVERPDMHLPQVGVHSGPDGVTGVEVAIGGPSKRVDVFATIEVMIPALQTALVLLEAE